MSTIPKVRIRRSLTDLQHDYKNGNKKPLEDLWRAFKFIEELPADHPHSFFTLGGYHGEPFRGAGRTDPKYWGGYCQHANVLFPTWHRVYVLKLEEALQSVDGCQDVMLPYWDETSEDSKKHGIPWALTREKVVLDGKRIDNPLRSFKFTASVIDKITGENSEYTKRKGYETVRYPLSGLVGTCEAEEATKKHNDQFPGYRHRVDLLNENIRAWLNDSFVLGDATVASGQLAKKFRDCLSAPCYTLFSNRTSGQEWNSTHEKADWVMSVEPPHDGIHLAVGGFDLPGQLKSRIRGANGDMGENDTAGLDPIFFFHHCFVDRIFWLWQKKHGCKDKLDIVDDYPGTNSSDTDPGPTPGFPPNTRLTLDSPLDPFTKIENGKPRPYTSRDCVNIKTQLGYDYGPGSLDDQLGLTEKPPVPSRTVTVAGISRANIRGSFLISVFGEVGGQRVHLGTEPVLSRWNVTNCVNCQTHLQVKAFVGVPPASSLMPNAIEAAEKELSNPNSYTVELYSHQPGVSPLPAGGGVSDTQPHFRFQVQ